MSNSVDIRIRFINKVTDEISGVKKHDTINQIKEKIYKKYKTERFLTNLIKLSYKRNRLSDSETLYNELKRIDKSNVKNTIKSTIELDITTNYMPKKPSISTTPPPKSRSIFNDFATIQRDLVNKGVDSLINLERKTFDSSSNKLAKLTKSGKPSKPSKSRKSSLRKTRKSRKTRKLQKRRSLSSHKKRRKRSGSTNRRRKTILLFF